MRRSQHSDEEIAVLLREAEEGVSIGAICEAAHISLRTFYRWRKKFGGLEPAAVKRLRSLERENQQLRLMIAQLKPENPDGVWSGWKSGMPHHRSESGLRAAGPGGQDPGQATRRTTGGVCSGRFAGLR